MLKENIPKEPLLELIKEIDFNLNKKIELFAVGGTGMTLLDLKASTKDIDFNLKPNDFEEFNKALKKTIHGYKIDIYCNGEIFSQHLPLDYIKKAIKIKTSFKNIILYSIHPIDIIVTKIGRLNDRDWEDIKDCIKKYNLTKQQILERGKKIIYIGNQELYEYNLKDVIKKMF
ncbi:MAG: DUF6036 family nucleotidyltransferase [Candidatus ainarchaeum sp.]|nr:DUF6036 family nucleotidyltransferase [Candidatus ainarchaeum sp.]